jgi:hypothetical protein
MIILTLSLSAVGYTETPDKLKLDQFFDRLPKKTRQWEVLS